MSDELNLRRRNKRVQDVTSNLLTSRPLPQTSVDLACWKRLEAMRQRIELEDPELSKDPNAMEHVLYAAIVRGLTEDEADYGQLYDENTGDRLRDDVKRLTYEGRLTIAHSYDDWGCVYVEEDPLGTVVAEDLGHAEEDYEFKEVVVSHARLVVDVIERDPPETQRDPIEGFQAPLPPEVPSSPS